jgi:hypothetical protein
MTPPDPDNCTEKEHEALLRFFRVLVEHAGAADWNEDGFVYAFTKSDYQATEWRFGGLLGFGGKFWRNAGKYYVTCYREDENKKTLAVIKRANEILAPYKAIDPRAVIA